MLTFSTCKSGKNLREKLGDMCIVSTCHRIDRHRWFLYFVSFSPGKPQGRDFYAHFTDEETV